MKYIVRLNSKAFNPLTKRVALERLWEVEQTADRDSGKVIWHCAEVRIDKTPISQLFKLPEPGGAPWSTTAFGIAVRAYDDAIEIRTGLHDASGH